MNRQGGSALIYIFVGIALFAALSYAVSQNNRSASNVGKDEKSSVQVSDYLTFANSIATTIKILKTQGCSDTQLNMQSPTNGYVNSTAPADKSCNVFDKAGGGLLDNKAPPGWFISNPVLSTSMYNSGYCIRGVGTGAAGTCLPENAELLLLTPSVTNDLCVSFNKAMDFNPPSYEPVDFSLYFVNFTGTYGGAVPPEISAPVFIGKKMGCIKQTGPLITGTYWIFYTLLAR